MKNRALLSVTLLPLLLTSCGNKDESKRVIFLSAKYVLASAAFNATYKPTAEPAYFSKIPGSTNCKELFDLKNSYIIYNVKIVNDKPIGYGSFNISFADKTIEDKSCDYFEYEIDYDRVYGGIIKFINGYSFDFIGQQSCRNHYAWTRLICNFPEIEHGKRMVLEFYVIEQYEEPTEFNYSINL